MASHMAGHMAGHMTGHMASFMAGHKAAQSYMWQSMPDGQRTRREGLRPEFAVFINSAQRPEAGKSWAGMLPLIFGTKSSHLCPMMRLRYHVLAKPCACRVWESRGGGGGEGNGEAAEGGEGEEEEGGGKGEGEEEEEEEEEELSLIHI